MVEYFIILLLIALSPHHYSPLDPLKNQFPDGASRVDGCSVEEGRREEREHYFARPRLGLFCIRP